MPTYPNGYKTSVSALGLSQPSNYVKASVNTIGQATYNQVCVYTNNKEFCIGPNYWNTNASTTSSSLKTAMQNALGITVNCGSTTTETWCRHSNYGSCGANNAGGVYCYGTSGVCELSSNGSVSCR